MVVADEGCRCSAGRRAEVVVNAEGCRWSAGGRAEMVVDNEGCRRSAGGRAEVVVNAEGCRCSAGGRDEVGSSTMHGGELDDVDETSWPHIVGEVEDPWRQDVNTHMQFASLVGTPTCMLLYMNALMRMSLPSVCWHLATALRHGVVAVWSRHLCDSRHSGGVIVLVDAGRLACSAGLITSCLNVGVGAAPDFSSFAAPSSSATL